VFLVLLCAALSSGALAQPTLYGPQLEGFDYPYPVKYHRLKSQAQQFVMAYMDVQPDTPAVRTMVLLHGKEFCGTSWQPTIAALHDAGYRVVVPDQVGFCKSSKPVNYQYSLNQLAANTNELLIALGAGRVTLIGHCMGGMIAMRYALMYPEQLERLVLVAPLGLEDWKAEGVPYRTVDERYAAELKRTADSIKQHELEDYFGGQWRPEYDRSVEAVAGLYAGTGRERYAWNQALTSDMEYTQPVLYELERIHTPTLLLVGARDRAAPFKEDASAEVAARLGNYPELARRAAARIANSHLIELADVGHVPQLEAPDQFREALLKWLQEPLPPPAPPPLSTQHPQPKRKSH
jgi:pimeloyl-ACP methyl ester carboxylesterase